MYSLNFLPEDAKRRHLRILLLRIMQQFLIVLLASLAVSAGLLLLIRNLMARTAGLLGQPPDTGERMIARDISALRVEISALAEIRGRERWLAPTLAAIIAALPPEISVHTLSAEDESHRVTVEGRAATRDAFLAFQDRLRANPGIEAVTAPLSSISQATNLSFILTATLSPTSTERTDL